MHQRVWRNEQRQYLLLLIFLPSRINRFLVLTFVNLRGFPCLNWVYILSSFSGLYFSGWLCLISASFGLCHSYSGVLMSICLIYVYEFHSLSTLRQPLVRAFSVQFELYNFNFSKMPEKNEYRIKLFLKTLIFMDKKYSILRKQKCIFMRGSWRVNG